ncbi:hypothetical protein QR680_000822 [Steinernema hermaphroditum]|uniref:Uncharacterized protein n=1 Tax=Steinernema hermaphroditum TaxID=289476 RepID=A0AA39GVZ9_9BILA|nr:hypothetical protein QR680_000822 [Steinernema hermaphroditum]
MNSSTPKADMNKASNAAATDDNTGTLAVALKEMSTNVDFETSPAIVQLRQSADEDEHGSETTSFSDPDVESIESFVPDGCWTAFWLALRLRLRRCFL